MDTQFQRYCRGPRRARCVPVPAPIERRSQRQQKGNGTTAPTEGRDATSAGRRGSDSGQICFMRRKNPVQTLPGG
jgi:hypothetical protein